jgi:hypothetical protein
MLKTFKQRLMARWAALAAVLLLVLGQALATFAGIRRTLPGWWMTLAATLGMLYLILDKTTFLPFLGETALPPSVLRVATPTEATIDVTVKAPRRATHVVYWAAASTGEIVPTPQAAYDGFANAGVVPVVNGTAVLPLQCPAPYKVRGKTLKKHVHYRAVYPDGILGRVQTQNILC